MPSRDTKQPKGSAEIEADRLERLRASYYRASRAAIAAEDAGRPDAKLDAAAQRAHDKLKAAERGEPATKSPAQLECEIAKALARDYETRTGHKLEIRKENAKWWVYSWIAGEGRPRSTSATWCCVACTARLICI